MADESTSTATSGTGAVAAKSAGNSISADTYRQMLDILDGLSSHSHIFYDDYATVCECQCQCDCGRGTL
jgi:hypothetical protein